MNYIVHYDILSACIVLVIIIANVFMPCKNQKLKGLYYAMLVVVFLSCVFDIISGILLSYYSQNSIHIIVEYVATSLYHCVHIIGPFLVALYVYYCMNDDLLSKKIIFYMSIPALICEFLVLINPLVGSIFTINDDIYQRGPFIFAMYVASILYLLSVVFYVLYKYKTCPKQVKAVVLCYVLVMSIGVVIQFIFPNVLLECCSMVIVLLIIYFAIQSKDMVEEAIKNQEEITRMATEASKAKSEFLANMSHEIRTPINTMLGMNQMIQREAQTLSVKRYAHNVENAGRVLLSLVNDILDFSKIEEGKFVITPEDYYVDIFIKDIVEEISPRAEDKSLDFIINVDSMIPRKLYGDSVRIRQCIINLLTNAVKYTHKGRIEFNIGYNRINARELMLNVSVKDTGIGVKTNDIEKLTGRFQRLDLEKNSAIEGTGLGLDITCNILALMESKLGVKSELGNGSEFSFSVRQSIVDNTSTGKVDYKRNTKLDTDVQVVFTAPDVKILVVDDNDMNLQVMRELLRANEVKVVTVESGEEALKATRKIAFDLIFMDYMMPVMNGGEALRTIREDVYNLCRNTPIIVLTANAIQRTREKYLAEGFDEYITKPVEYNVLQDMLINILPDEKLKIKRT